MQRFIDRLQGRPPIDEDFWFVGDQKGLPRRPLVLKEYAAAFTMTAEMLTDQPAACAVITDIPDGQTPKA